MATIRGVSVEATAVVVLVLSANAKANKQRSAHKDGRSFMGPNKVTTLSYNGRREGLYRKSIRNVTDTATKERSYVLLIRSESSVQEMEIVTVDQSYQ